MDYRIKEILSKIETNFTHPLNVNNLAESLKLSVYYLQHLFKKEVGISITKYIKDLRIQKAGEYLEDTNLSVKEIRVKVGITNDTHFFHDFKQKFGSTPTEYRKNFRK